ncbi:MAG: hypothetical protein ACKO0W_11915 [Planctomycetota bacterium]
MNAVTALISALVAASASADAITHRFLAFGAQTRIVEEDGRTSWTFPEGTRDGQMLDNGHVLLALSKSDARPHGAVIEVVPDPSGKGGKTVFEFAGTQSEVNTVQRLSDGRTMLTEAGEKPRILIVDAGGRIVRETPIRSQTDNHHMESRMARMLPGGNALVPQLLDKVVREYAPDGSVVAEFRTPEEPKDSWPFTAIRLPDGNTLVTCTHGNMVVEFDPKGAIVWQVSNADLGKPLLNDPCGAQRLPNGNTVICSYAIGAERTKLVEVTRDKRVVWTFCEPEGAGIHEVEILRTNGARLEGAPLR